MCQEGIGDSVVNKELEEGKRDDAEVKVHTVCKLNQQAELS